MLKEPVKAKFLSVEILYARSSSDIKDYTNKWLQEHPEVTIHDLIYQLGPANSNSEPDHEHSVFILFGPRISNVQQV